jgi:hypothetical protein
MGRNTYTWIGCSICFLSPVIGHIRNKILSNPTKKREKAEKIEYRTRETKIKNSLKIRIYPR